MSDLTVNIIDDKLVIEIPVNKPIKPSKKGKTLLVASSGGCQGTEAIVDGKKIYVNLNAFVYP